MENNTRAKDALNLEIVTPEGCLYQEKASAVTLPSFLGSLGVLRDHAPLMCTLREGIISYTQDGMEYLINISAGIADINNNTVLVLVKTAERQRT
jgi:F-type H+-transporting ATPase subunit epsilon